MCIRDSCRLIDKFSQPNLELIYPLPTGSGDESATDKMSEVQLEELKTQFEKKSKDIYSKIKLKNANTIKVNSIRDIKKKLSMSQGVAGRRVVIVSDADKMNTEAANAFLKTLKEPNSFGDFHSLLKLTNHLPFFGINFIGCLETIFYINRRRAVFGLFYNTCLLYTSRCV